MPDFTVDLSQHPGAIRVACSNCNLRELCMPPGLSHDDLRQIDGLVAGRRKIKRGTALFRGGEKFTSLLAVRTGVFKNCLRSEDGRDQMTGFQMAAELMGLDGIVNERHSCDAIALEDSEVCVMPCERIETVGPGARVAAPRAQGDEPRDRARERHDAFAGQ